MSFDDKLCWFGDENQTTMWNKVSLDLRDYPLNGMPEKVRDGVTKF